MSSRANPQGSELRRRNGSYRSVVQYARPIKVPKPPSFFRFDTPAKNKRAAAGGTPPPASGQQSARKSIFGRLSSFFGRNKDDDDDDDEHRDEGDAPVMGSNSVVGLNEEHHEDTASDPDSKLFQPPTNILRDFAFHDCAGQILYFATSRLHCARFGFYHGQRLQYNTGFRRGEMTSVIGVRAGRLWVWDDVDNFAVPVEGRNEADIDRRYKFSIEDEIVLESRLPPSTWSEETIAFLKCAPDIVLSIGDEVHDDKSSVLLSPTCTTAGVKVVDPNNNNSTKPSGQDGAEEEDGPPPQFLGWSGEGIVMVQGGGADDVFASLSGSVFIPLQEDLSSSSSSEDNDKEERRGEELVTEESEQKKSYINDEQQEDNVPLAIRTPERRSHSRKGTPTPSEKSQQPHHSRRKRGEGEEEQDHEDETPSGRKKPRHETPKKIEAVVPPILMSPENRNLVNQPDESEGDE